jgi:hypothetical protein
MEFFLKERHVSKLVSKSNPAPKSAVACNNDTCLYALKRDRNHYSRVMIVYWFNVAMSTLQVQNNGS